MNARQTKKLLKKKIDKLQSDNDLMHNIIADSPTMQETYDNWTKPLNVVHSSMRFQKFVAKKTVDIFEGAQEIEYATQFAAKELLEKIKDNITYKVDTDWRFPTVTASIIVAYNDQKEDV